MKTWAKAVVMVVVLLGLGIAVVHGQAAKDEIIFGIGEPPTSGSWDPVFNFGFIDFRVQSLIFDRLWDYDENMKLVPKLATSWKQMDAKTLRVVLRKGVKFHDGTPFTARDVKATLERASRPDIPHGCWWVPVKVDMVDDYTVDISTEKPFAPLKAPIAITDILCAKDITNAAKLKSQPNGTGYYRYVSYRDNKVVLEANQDYWGGPPKVKRVVFYYIEDTAARLAALVTGEVTFIDRLRPEQIAALRSVPGVNLLFVPSLDLVWMGINLDNKYLKDVRVRHAIAMAIDRKSMVDVLLAGYARVADAVFAKGVPGYTPMKQYPFDPKKAKQLLREAGYEQGFTLRLPVTDLFMRQKEVSLLIAQNLADIGIRVELMPLEVGAYRIEYANYDLFINSWADLTGDADMALALYFPPFGTSIFKYKDEKAEQLFAAQRVAPEDKRPKLIEDVNEYLWDQVPALPLYTFDWVFAYQKYVKGYKKNQTFGELLHDVYLED